MPRTELLNRLLRLTKTAHTASQKKLHPAEYAEEQLYNSRRAFLQTGFKAGIATALLAGCSKTIDYGTSNPPADDPANASIVIVGAGIAGLHAAYVLKQAGIRSTIYEASGRTGGRIFTAQNILNNGISTELGGEFIDSSHADMLSLAQQFNLPLLDLHAPEELTLQQNVYFFQGNAYSDQNFIEDIRFYIKKIKADAATLSGKITYKSYSPADVKFDNMSLEEYFDSINMNGWIRECLLVAYLGEFGLNTDVCNAINFLYLFGKNEDGVPALYGESDQRFKIKGGNQRVTDELTACVKDQVNLEHRLIRITENKKGYNLYFDNNGTTVTVQADIALLTLPFTILRDVEIQADDLPEVKRNAIRNLSYGSNSKLLLGFNGKSWRTDYKSAGMSYSDAGTQNSWDGSQMQEPTNGGYTVYLGGDSATNLSRNTAAANAQQYLSMLDKVYPGISKTYNNKAQQFVWRDYPYAKASYSSWSVGQYTTIAGSEGEAVGNLFFAGEHTSYNSQGYMNGGAATGRIAAENVLRKINKMKGN